MGRLSPPTQYQLRPTGRSGNWQGLEPGNKNLKFGNGKNKDKQKMKPPYLQEIFRYNTISDLKQHTQQTFSILFATPLMKPHPSPILSTNDTPCLITQRICPLIR